MSLYHRYRNFGGAKSPAQIKEDPALGEIEEQKLQAFEAGYKAGWDDALKAQADAKKQLSDDLNQSLQEISFSYREAISKVASSMQPIMENIISKLLPELVRTGLSAHINEQVQTMLNGQIDQPIEIVVSAENLETVKELLEPQIMQQFNLVADDDIGPGQAFVRIADTERQIDLDGVIAGVSAAMKAFFHETAQEQDNG